MANDWNVDDYRMEHETNDHWELRKKFMLAHKDEYPEEKVVCLAQVFANVEFMGCRYPQETMELVAELSRGVVEEYRLSRRTKLKRTFVAASDAAGAKVKGQKIARDFQNTGDPSGDVANNSRNEVILTGSGSENNVHSITYGPSIADLVQKREHLPPVVSMPATCNNPTKSSNTSPTFSSIKFFQKKNLKPIKQPKSPSDISNFVIVRTKDRTSESSMEVLQRSAISSGFKLDVRSECQVNVGNVCEIYLDGKLEATITSAETKKAAREKAAAMVLDKLKISSHTLLLKDILSSDTVVEKSHVLNEQKAGTSTESELLSDNNVGTKLLKLMGWTGGGLGANNQGITEPITAQEHVRRTGLGLSAQDSKPSKEFKTKLWKMLREYALDPDKTCKTSLVFSADFSKEERAEIHHIAHRLKLKSRSYNKKERQLVVSHRYTIRDIVAELINSGGSNEKYELIPPTSVEVIQID